ncbi:MAG: class I SAM-dependent methyltransferase [Actinomycetota bacterium]|nr:class I SAM-dependent methyltransferase [Actinomycetota bacterium]
MTGEAWEGYVARFDHLADTGEDLDGEARFIDVLAPRSARILDAGAGTGRVAAALTRMGHLALGVDRDTGLVEHARARYLGVPYLAGDLLDLDPEVLADEGFGDPFDVVALAGNVLVFVAPGTESDVLRTMRGLLRPGGRLVAGFATDRDYTVDALDADLVATGFVHEHRFSTWQLDRWRDDADWQVTVARRPA